MTTRFMAAAVLAATGLAAFATQAAAEEFAASAEGETNIGMDGTAVQNWQWLLGLGIPLFVAWLVKAQYKDRTKALIMLATCIVVTGITLFIQGQLNDLSSANIVTKLLALLAIAVTMYYGLWRPLGVTTKLQNMRSPIPGGQQQPATDVAAPEATYS